MFKVKDLQTCRCLTCVWVSASHRCTVLQPPAGFPGLRRETSKKKKVWFSPQNRCESTPTASFRVVSCDSFPPLLRGKEKPHAGEDSKTSRLFSTQTSGDPPRALTRGAGVAGRAGAGLGAPVRREVLEESAALLPLGERRRILGRAAGIRHGAPPPSLQKTKSSLDEEERCIRSVTCSARPPHKSSIKSG